MKNNGGPAFPTAYADRNTFGDQIIMYEDGMTLRDWFAGMAMQGFCADRGVLGVSEEGVAHRAYKVADAMLKAREAGDV